MSKAIVDRKDDMTQMTDWVPITGFKPETLKNIYGVNIVNNVQGEFMVKVKVNFTNKGEPLVPQTDITDLEDILSGNFDATHPEIDRDALSTMEIKVLSKESRITDNDEFLTLLCEAGTVNIYEVDDAYPKFYIIKLADSISGGKVLTKTTYDDVFAVMDLLASPPVVLAGALENVKDTLEIASGIGKDLAEWSSGKAVDIKSTIGSKLESMISKLTTTINKYKK